MRHHKRTCITIFSKLGLADQSKPCKVIYLQKNVKLHKNLQLLIVILKKIFFLDMHHYQNVHVYQFSAKSGSWISHNVHTNLFAKKSQFA